MINREILYERNLTGSFMKIPASFNSLFDEKIMLKRKLPGLLPVEKCFFNGSGQYWYNITGKQSLDTYCSMKEIGIAFIERIIISICSQIEILEWNLIDTNCLVLDPELVYITNQSGEIIFTLYPNEKGNLAQELQHLMEYLITKVDHKDMEAVHAAYGIYEKTLDPAYSIIDIRDSIVEAKKISARERMEEQKLEEMSEQDDNVKSGYTRRTGEFDIGKKIARWKENLRVQNVNQRKIVSKIPLETYSRGNKFKESRVDRHRDKQDKQVNLPSKYMQRPKKQIHYGLKRPLNMESKVAETVSYEVSMHEEIREEMPKIHPTVYLGNYQAKPQGLLLYEGAEQLENIHLEQKSIRIGQGSDVDVQIQKETISHFHAKIDCQDDEYYLEDLNSTNGTFLNGESLPYKEKRKLSMNDIVQFANIRYRFV